MWEEPSVSLKSLGSERRSEDRALCFTESIVFVRLEIEDWRREPVREDFNVGLVRGASDESPFHVADGGKRGGGIPSNLAANDAESEVSCGLDMLCRRIPVRCDDALWSISRPGDNRLDCLAESLLDKSVED